MKVQAAHAKTQIYGKRPFYVYKRHVIALGFVALSKDKTCKFSYY